jgi:hypothetical protein
MTLIGQINLFQILNYKVTMTIEKWLKEEKMRLGRFKIYCVNAQKEGLKSVPLKMPRSCWSGQYRTWDDSIDALSIRVGPDDKPLSVVAMRVRNPGRSPVGINR